MNIINLCCVLVILCGVSQIINGKIMNCKFIHLDVYSCRVTSLDNTNNSMNITGYTGFHEDNKIDTDVKMILIQDTNTRFIPTNLGSLFSLTKLVMHETQLVEIKSNDFKGMENLKELFFPVNKLTSLPIDAFATLPKLTLISLSSNQIKQIENGVFANNLQLEQIVLSNNKIKLLGSTLFDGLTNLRYVNLENNICIHNSYSGDTELIQLKNVFKLNCIVSIQQ